MNAPRLSPRLGLGLPLILAGATLVACSSGSSDAVRPSEKVGRTASPVISGKNSDKSQDAVVLLIHYDPAQREFASCTGTLLSDRLVLTARHCVADTDESAACDSEGTPLAQGAIRGNHTADTLYVFTGPNRPDFSRGDVTPAGIGAKIVDDGGKNLCNHDIALLILKEPIKNAKIASLRLDAPIKMGESLTAVGWGVTDTTPSPDVRQQRSGIKVEGIGPSDTSLLPVPPNEFEVGESICSGDSGGPAFASTGAIVGVVSRGGNATKPNPNDPASSCIGGENLYTKVSPFKKMIEDGLKLVDAEPWYEGGADPRLLKPGSACSDGSECRSNLCLLDPSQEGATTCAADCSTEGSVCGDGEVCTAEGDAHVCRVPAPAATNNAAATTTTTTGCATGPGNTSSGGALGIVLAALGLVALRRRRS
jgi:MYXO-CTERM domain-containing protein